MAEELVDAIEARSDIRKRKKETFKEYIERVGQTEDLDPDVVNAATAYITEYQYAQSTPTDDTAIWEFLDALESGGTTAAKTATEMTDDAKLLESAQTVGGDNRDTNTEASDTVVSDPAFELPPALQPIRAAERQQQLGFRGGLGGREPKKLLVWFSVMLITGPLLGWLLGRTWVPGHLLYDYSAAALATGLGLSPIEALELMGMVGLGLYAGVLVLFIADVKKRVQGMLLLVASVIALAILAVMGVFIPNIEFTTPLNAAGL